MLTVKKCKIDQDQVWCGMSSDKIVNPFLQGTVNAERYLIMVGDEVWPMCYDCVYFDIGRVTFDSPCTCILYSYIVGIYLVAWFSAIFFSLAEFFAVNTYDSYSF